jgi:hypothetical protein
MVLLTALGRTNPGNFVLFDRLSNNLLVLLTVGYAFLVTSTATARRLPAVAKSVLVTAEILLGLMFAPLAWMLFPVFRGGSSTVPAPDGSAYEAVIQEGTDVIDPIWGISVRQRSGLLARVWEVGCLSGDDPVNALDSVSWDGPGRLVIQTSDHGRVTVDVSPTGNPGQVQDPGILGC